jgi:hypothetical protein
MSELGMDRANMGQDYDKTICPDECRGELRDSCGGCDYYDEEGNER